MTGKYWFEEKGNMKRCREKSKLGPSLDRDIMFVILSLARRPAARTTPQARNALCELKRTKNGKKVYFGGISVLEFTVVYFSEA